MGWTRWCGAVPASTPRWGRSPHYSPSRRCSARSPYGASAGSRKGRSDGKGRLKGGCRQDCLPHLPRVGSHPTGVDLDGADLAAVEVHRAGESIPAIGDVPATDDVDRSDDPLIAAGIVVDAGVEELDATPAEALSRLPADRTLALVDGLFGGEAAGCAVLGASVAVDGAVDRAGDGAPDSGVVAAAGGTGVVTAAPNEVEGIAFGAAIGIFNVDDGHSSVARIAEQLLAAAAIDAGKSEIGRVGGEGCAALEAAPLRRAARDIPDGSLVAADLDIRDPVDYHFDGALAAIAAATGDHGGAALVLLSTCQRRHDEDCCESVSYTHLRAH